MEAVRIMKGLMLEVAAEEDEFGFGGGVELLVEEAVDGAEFGEGVCAGDDGGCGAGSAWEARAGVGRWCWAFGGSAAEGGACGHGGGVCGHGAHGTASIGPF
jgi:hypothetical protein